MKTQIEFLVRFRRYIQQQKIHPINMKKMYLDNGHVDESET